MISFKLNSNIIWAVDNKGIAIINKRDGSHSFIQYPEAAVWAVLVENHSSQKSIQMIHAISNKTVKDSENYIIECLGKWEGLNFIQ